MDSSYKKIYSGNRFTVQRIEDKLQEVDIKAVIKDESESARLAGFAANVDGALEVFVHTDQFDKAMMIVRAISAQQAD
ncbi:putative signal transducing protein [Flavobacteriaceae bacterium MAR_2009_75]|nr:putative signal transducing protein [Flavobacteriaceae bacterium MAR_2009_75]